METLSFRFHLHRQTARRWSIPVHDAMNSWGSGSEGDAVVRGNRTLKVKDKDEVEWAKGEGDDLFGDSHTASPRRQVR